MLIAKTVGQIIAGLFELFATFAVLFFLFVCFVSFNKDMAAKWQRFKAWRKEQAEKKRQK